MDIPVSGFNGSNPDLQMGRMAPWEAHGEPEPGEDIADAHRRARDEQMRDQMGRQPPPPGGAPGTKLYGMFDNDPRVWEELPRTGFNPSVVFTFLDKDPRPPPDAIPAN